MLKDYDLSKVPEVHFCNDNSDLAYVVNSTLNSDNTSITAKVPNKLLEESLPLYCYIYLTDSTDETSMKTIVYVELPVKKRKKPDDYHYEDDSDVISLRDRVSKLETYAHTIVAGFVPMFSEDGVNGLNWSIYRWADGTTTFDKIKQNPDLAGTEILIGASVYKYSNVIVGDDGVVPFGCGHLEFQRMVDGTEDGVVNERGHHLPCGYAAIKGKGSETFNSLTLYDENENVIQADSDGDLEQCAILYDESYSVKGFKIDKNTKKAYLSDYVLKSGTTQNATGGVVLSNNGCVASGSHSLSGGGGCTASGDYSISFGGGNTVTTYGASAIGVGNTVKGVYSNSFGSGNCVYGSGSFSAGEGNNVYSTYSFVSGHANTLGNSSTPSNTHIYTFGSDNISCGGYIYGFGFKNTIGLSGASSHIFVIGQNNQAYSSCSLVLGDSCIVGIEPTTDNPSPKQNSHCYAIGSGSKTSGNLSLSFGGRCSTTGNYSLTFGTGSSNSGNWSVAIGSGTNVEADYSFAFGGESVYIHSGANNSIALMSGARVYSPQSVAIGYGSVAGVMYSSNEESPTQNPHCFSFGVGCYSNGGQGSLATGNATTAYSSSQFVAGKANKVDSNGKYAVIIGNGDPSAVDKRSNAIAIDWQGKIYVNNSDTGVDVLDLLNRVKALEAAVNKLS